ETNCWLFVVAQHPQANAHFIHYTSPRMHCEAKAETNKIVHTFSTVINNLILARRAKALELAQKLSEANESKKEADAELARKEALIAEY
ncbi:hypothetical protein SERLA73DRAFT_62642, partial [Serpula lacrymans var. lacrymans S7.3]